jgi:hypothetical protein
VEQLVALFGDAAAAQRAFAQMTAPAAQRCFRGELRDAVRANAGGAEVGPVEQLGARSTATRRDTQLAIPVAADIGGAAAYVDTAIERIGRGIASTVFISALVPNARPTVAAVTRAVEARLTKALR